MLSDAAFVAICTAVPLLVAQVVNLIISGRNHLKITEVAIKVDGTASASKQREESLQKEIVMLKEVLAEKKETASLLAQAQAQAVSSVPAEVIVKNEKDQPIPVSPSQQ